MSVRWVGGAWYDCYPFAAWRIPNFRTCCVPGTRAQSACGSCLSAMASHFSPPVQQPHSPGPSAPRKKCTPHAIQCFSPSIFLRLDRI
ncbi:hypothetical protein C0Q70_18680 [Pomacea canaliculata]|uniref:Uncharacterized protein n=1 Tax=Pomacea canaliculata TaxID=400727 RepID=A0A2T7NH71_POMCA|nr:hypothetical protein C0Q70_18680 [Pomacea canaliculata]